MSEPSMRTLVLAELDQALQDGPLYANLDEDEPSISTAEDLRALGNEDLLIVLITMLSDA